MNGNFFLGVCLRIHYIQDKIKIVSRIEEEQQVVDANKKLIELYQGKIKEKIDEVWGG